MFVMDCSKEIDLACNLNKSKMQPKQILLAWIEAFNKADVNGLATLYHDDAINHQVVNEPVQGKDSIAKMFEDGEWVIMEWKDPKGLRGCGFFQIVDNKIKLQRGYWDRLSFMKLYQND